MSQQFTHQPDHLLLVAPQGKLLLNSPLPILVCRLWATRVWCRIGPIRASSAPTGIGVRLPARTLSRTAKTVGLQLAVLVVLWIFSSNQEHEVLVF